MRMYHGLRRDVSLLLSEGHPHVHHYAVATVWSEARIVRQRRANRVKLDAVMSQLVLSALFSKEAGAELTKTLNRMDEVD